MFNRDARTDKDKDFVRLLSGTRVKVERGQAKV